MKRFGDVDLAVKLNYKDLCPDYELADSRQLFLVVVVVVVMELVVRILVAMFLVVVG